MGASWHYIFSNYRARNTDVDYYYFPWLGVGVTYRGVAFFIWTFVAHISAFYVIFFTFYLAISLIFFMPSLTMEAKILRIIGGIWGNCVLI